MKPHDEGLDPARIDVRVRATDAPDDVVADRNRAMVSAIARWVREEAARIRAGKA